MNKETLATDKYFKSGLYEKAFYKKKYINEDNPILAQADYVKSHDYFIVEGVDARYVEKFNPYDFDIEEASYLEYVERVGLLRKINLDEAVYKPKIFDKKIALQCGLIPFCYIKHIYEEHESIVKLLALPGSFDQLKPRLDAYHALTEGTTDRNSSFFDREKVADKM